MEKILHTIRKFIPRSLFRALQPGYHFVLSFFGAVIYRSPSREIILIGITGTKGKTTTVELVNTIFEKAGHKTAIASTLRIKVGDDSQRNLFKMTMPGRFFLQRFLRRAVSEGCTHAIIEMTSEGTKLYRHKFLALDALIFTNLSPEHIESHGSYENYVAAKLKIAQALADSPKKHRVLVVNADDEQATAFLRKDVPTKVTYSLEGAKPFSAGDRRSTFTYHRRNVSLPLPGVFNIYNALAALTLAEAFDIPTETGIAALESFSGVRGRAEFVSEGQPFDVIVDYAHTPDSLKSIYTAFYKPRICVLGGTGGGRDTWKRKEMGAIAAEYCKYIILTDEDPYDENPQHIVEQIAEGITTQPHEIIMDRREAIAKALRMAAPTDIVLITGKGTDPYIMGPNDSKTPWDDATVAREELRKLHSSTSTEQTEEQPTTPIHPKPEKGRYRKQRKH